MISDWHKKDMGTYGEAMVAAQVLAHRCAVFTDFGDNSKTDLIVEDSQGRLHRVQVKAVGRENASPNVSKLYLYKNGPNYRFTYTAAMLDWFALVDIETNKIAWISAKEALETCKTQMTLRHDAPSNNQLKGVRLFDDFTGFPFK